MALQLEHRMPETKPICRTAEAETVDLGRPWTCANWHLLGYVKRIGGVRRLYLPDGHVITGLAEIRCSTCGTLRTWHWGQDGIEQILASTGRGPC